LIGKPMESKTKTGADGVAGQEMMGMPMGMPMGMSGEMPMMENLGGVGSQALQVDYSTGYMLMDVQVRTNWIIPIRSQTVSNMLYLDDQNRILTLATKKSNSWPKELNAEYNAVKLEASKATGLTPEGLMMPGGEGLAPDMTTMTQDIRGF